MRKAKPTGGSNSSTAQGEEGSLPESHSEQFLPPLKCLWSLLNKKSGDSACGCDRDLEQVLAPVLPPSTSALTVLQREPRATLVVTASCSLRDSGTYLWITFQELGMRIQR